MDESMCFFLHWFTFSRMFLVVRLKEMIWGLREKKLFFIPQTQMKFLWSSKKNHIQGSKKKLWKKVDDHKIGIEAEWWGGREWQQQCQLWRKWLFHCKWKSFLEYFIFHIFRERVSEWVNVFGFCGGNILFEHWKFSNFVKNLCRIISHSTQKVPPQKQRMRCSLVTSLSLFSYTSVASSWL